MDVEPLIYSGRTYVPVRFIAENLGMTVKWNETTNMVEIESVPAITPPIINPIPTSQGDIDKLKLYNRISNVYESLAELGEYIYSTSNELGLASDYIFKDNNPDYIKTVNERIDQRGLSLANMIMEVAGIRDESIKYNINLKDMDTILNFYHESLEGYKVSSKSLYNYWLNRNSSDFDIFLNNRMDAHDKFYSGLNLATVGYHKYYNLIQNY